MAMVSAKIADILCTILLHLLAFLLGSLQCVLSKSPSTANFPLTICDHFIDLLKLYFHRKNGDGIC